MTRKKTHKKAKHHQKDTPKKKKPEPQNQSPEQLTKKEILNRVSKGFLLSIAFLLLLVMVYFLYNKLTRPQSISELLPAEKTLGYIEINIDPTTSQTRELQNLLADYPHFQTATLKRQLETLLQISFDKDIFPWIGRRISFAVTAEQDGAYIKYVPIGFIEIRNQEKALEFLKNLSLTKDDELKQTLYQKTPIYYYPSSYNLNFTFINNYLVFSSNDTGVKTIIDSLYNSSQKVVATPQFHKIRNNTPQKNIVFAYLDLDQTLKALNRNPSLLRSKTQELKSFSPYLRLFKSAGFAVVADQPNLHIQQFVYLDKEKFPGKQFISTEEKYNHELAQFVEKNIALYAGGQNLTEQIQNLFEILKANTATSSIVFEGVLYNEVARFFGNDISLEQHIYPLLEGEYAFVIGLSENKPDIKLLLELTEPEKDTLRFKTVLESFRKVSALFAPKVVEHELPDGTIAKEVIANENAVVSETNIYKGQSINSLKMGNQPWGVHYAIITHKNKTFAVIASQKESVLSTIDTLSDENENFTQSELFSEIARKQLPHSQEGVMANLSFLGLLENSKALKPYLAPFQKLVITKNYFDDGISTIYTFKVE